MLCSAGNQFGGGKTSDLLSLVAYLLKAVKSYSLGSGVRERLGERLSEGSCFRNQCQLRVLT